ncbi:TPA: hypothetical protein ACOJM5_001762 [Pseudomonas putida]
MGFLKRLTGVIFSFWFLLTFVALVAGAAALAVYRMHFLGGFSTQSADWSAFGSYIGGILGPLVSFLTLGAVLRTVYLQRDLLSTQKAEFIKLSDQQVASLQKQDEQLQLAREEAARAMVQNHLSNQFRLVEMFIAHQQRQAEAMSAAAFRITELDQGTFAQRMEAAQPALDDKELAMKNVQELLNLSVKLSLMEFNDTKEINELVAPSLLKVLTSGDAGEHKAVSGGVIVE